MRIIFLRVMIFLGKIMIEQFADKAHRLIKEEKTLHNINTD